MQAQVTTAPTPPAIKTGILVLDGYGIRVAVERRHLVVADGLGRARRWGRFSKATAGLRRLVVLGHTGTVSLEALRWLHDIGAAFVQIDADGQVIIDSGPMGLDDARLRRAQALAVANGVGVGLARVLVRDKLRGQATVLKNLSDSGAAAAVIRQTAEQAEHAKNLERLRIVESEAAVAYWTAWRDIPVRFGRRDEDRLPDHWRTFGTRTSPLTGSPRSATNPANAILNYLYALLEAEAGIAVLAVGLDPGIGILHADQRNRDSLACDLMEPIRPEVDAFVLELLRSRVFRAADFHETRQGICRVLPPFTHVLAETAPAWARYMAPVAERVAGMLTDGQTRRVSRLPTPLTQANRSAGRNPHRRRPKLAAQARRPSVPRACQKCGEEVKLPRRLFCDQCLRDYREEALVALQAAGPASLKRLMAEGRDPTHGGEAAQKRAASLSKRTREAAAWEQRHGRPDSSEFTRDILPRLQGIPLSRLVEATGLSVRYCSLIRRGMYVPHPRHWESLGKYHQGRVPDRGGADQDDTSPEP